MSKIIGNTTATPNPRPDWNQTDETKADYIKNKPTIIDKFSEVDGKILYNGEQISGIGESGATFIPSVSEGGDLSWSNDKGLDNPTTVNIKGDPYTLTESDKEEIVEAVLEGMPEIEGSSNVVVDSTLTVEGTAADAKATGDRLEAIEKSIPTKTSDLVNDSDFVKKSDIPADKSYELTDEAYIHTNLPDGNKTVSYVHNGDEFGSYEWVVVGEDLTSKGMFNCSFPDNGISITPEDNGFVLTGTPLLGEQSYYFVDSNNNIDFTLPNENGYIYIRSFSSSNNEAIASDMLYVDVETYDADKVYIDSERADLSSGRVRISTLNSVSEAFVRIKITVKDTGAIYNHKFQIHVIVGNGEKALNLDTTTDISYNSFISFPYKTTVTYKAGLDYRLDRIESRMSQFITQFDTSLIAAIGDGVIE